MNIEHDYITVFERFQKSPSARFDKKRNWLKFEESCKHKCPEYHFGTPAYLSTSTFRIKPQQYDCVTTCNKHFVNTLSAEIYIAMHLLWSEFHKNGQPRHVSAVRASARFYIKYFTFSDWTLNNWLRVGVWNFCFVDLRLKISSTFSTCMLYIKRVHSPKRHCLTVAGARYIQKRRFFLLVHSRWAIERSFIFFLV